MKILQLQISNFRGISSGVINLQGHTLLVGDHNSGKTTVCDALGLILSVDRLNHFPVIDEYDFYNRLYIDEDGQSVEIQLKAILTDLSTENQLRFKRYLRPWNKVSQDFADAVQDRNLVGDGSKLHWVLPVIFIGRYDKNERDFIAGTYFDYPLIPIDDAKNVNEALGSGRCIFGRAEKRHCGFLFLGSQRKSSQLLSLCGGSLLDRIVALSAANQVDDFIEQPLQFAQTYPNESALPENSGEFSCYNFLNTRPLSSEAERYILEKVPPGKIRDELREAISQFVNHEPNNFDLPVDRKGSGGTGLMLIELLKSVVELRGSAAVSLIMEEPEEGLPPHKLGQLIRVIVSGMTQVVVTTNSTAVTEQFETHNIVVLSSNATGAVCAASPNLASLSVEASKLQHRQITVAVLGTGALVVDSDAAAAAFREASIVLQKSSESNEYAELSYAGISIIQTDSVQVIPQYGPILKAINKKAFAFYSIPEKEFNDENSIKLDDYVAHWQSPALDFESLLMSETLPAIHRRFLDAADELDSYPRHCGTYDALLDGDNEVNEMAIAVLRARKDCSDDMAGLFIRQCRSAEELPVTIRNVLLEIHSLTATRFDSEAIDPIH